MLYIKHESTLKNGPYPIRIKFNEMNEEAKKCKTAKNQKRIYQVLQDGMTATNVTVFGREKMLLTVPSAQNREMFVDFDLNLRRGSPVL